MRLGACTALGCALDCDGGCEDDFALFAVLCPLDCAATAAAWRFLTASAPLVRSSDKAKAGVTACADRSFFTSSGASASSRASVMNFRE